MTDPELFFGALFILGAVISAFSIGRAWGKCEQEIQTFKTVFHIRRN